MTKSQDFRSQKDGFSHGFECVVTPFSMCGDVLQRVALPKGAPLRDVLQQAALRRCGAGKIQSMQWLGGLRNSATLLLLKIKYITYVYTYTHAYRASSRGVFEMLRPPGPLRRMRVVNVALGALGGVR